MNTRDYLFNIDEVKEIYDHCEKADVIAVDEAFMIQGIADVLIDLYKKGKKI